MPGLTEIGEGPGLTILGDLIGSGTNGVPTVYDDDYNVSVEHGDGGNASSGFIRLLNLTHGGLNFKGGRAGTTDGVSIASARGGDGGALEVRALNVIFTGPVNVNGGNGDNQVLSDSNGNGGSFIINGALTTLVDVVALGGDYPIGSVAPGYDGTITLLGVTSTGQLSANLTAFGGCDFPSGSFNVVAGSSFNMGGNSIND